MRGRKLHRSFIKLVIPPQQKLQRITYSRGQESMKEEEEEEERVEGEERGEKERRKEKENEEEEDSSNPCFYSIKLLTIKL